MSLMDMLYTADGLLAFLKTTYNRWTRKRRRTVVASITWANWKNIYCPQCIWRTRTSSV